MKAKKFLKIVKSLCCDENCESGNCPMVVKKKNYFNLPDARGGRVSRQLES